MGDVSTWVCQRKQIRNKKRSLVLVLSNNLAAWKFKPMGEVSKSAVPCVATWVSLHRHNSRVQINTFRVCTRSSFGLYNYLPLYIFLFIAHMFSFCLGSGLRFKVASSCLLNFIPRPGPVLLSEWTSSSRNVLYVLLIRCIAFKNQSTDFFFVYISYKISKLGITNIK